MVRVPCGYRDIPLSLVAINVTVGRSLWVQGYTGNQVMTTSLKVAFPVGTGIYRTIYRTNLATACVPCGYRDIPLPTPRGVFCM